MNMWQKLIQKLLRRLCLRRHRSTVPTGLVPLSGLSSAVIYLDNPGDILESRKISISTFFKRYGIQTSWMHSEDEDLRSSSDLFISLSSAHDINERYAAESSSARFKIGRSQLKGDVYDFVVTDNGPEPAPASEAFDVIEHFIVNIQ